MVRSWRVCLSGDEKISVCDCSAMSFGIIFKTDKSGFRFGISAVSMMVFMSVDISISLRVKTKIIIIKS